MSEKSEKWRKEFRSWRSMYPNLVIHKSNKSNEEKEKKRKHIKIDPKSKKIIGFDGKPHEYSELSEREKNDLMLLNKYWGDKLWKELNSEEIEPEQ